MSELQVSLGTKVRRLRQSLGLTQEELAEKAGLSPKHLGELERGRGNPTLSNLEALAEALTISLVDLFDLEGARLNQDKVKEAMCELIDRAGPQKREFIFHLLRYLPIK